VAKYKSRLLIIAVLGLIGIVFEVAKPLPVKIVIDNVLSNHPLPGFISSFLRIAILQPISITFYLPVLDYYS
jgi:ABC-type bacteriocin/lantibiotic exporter with double-glycine peptidase domain